MTSKQLEDIDLEILRAIATGGITEVPEPEEDSGHTKWLVDNGFADERDDGLVLTPKGQDALKIADSAGV